MDILPFTFHNLFGTLTFGVVFAGLWALVWHWGLLFGLLILCVAGFILSPVGKAQIAGIGVAILIVLAAYTVGIRDEKEHCAAQVTLVQKALANAEATPKATRKHPVRYRRVLSDGSLDGPITCTKIRSLVAGKTLAQLEALRQKYHVTEAQLARFKECLEQGV